MRTQYSDHGVEYGLYLFNSTDLRNIKKMVRTHLSASRVLSFRGMAIYEPTNLAMLRTDSTYGQTRHNAQWLNRKIKGIQGVGAL